MNAPITLNELEVKIFGLLMDVVANLHESDGHKITLRVAGGWVWTF